MMVSVIIPTYNRAELLVETILSVFAQTYSKLEIIVVDDGSTDQTETEMNRLIKIDNRLRFFKRSFSFPKGANSCRNYGFSLSKGECIKWMDSDDLLHPKALEKQVENLLDQNSDLSICEAMRFSQSKNGKPTRNLNGSWGNVKQSISLDNYVAGRVRWGVCTGLWRKSFFYKKNHSIWDEELMNSQEWLMHLQSLIKGVRVSVFSEVLCYIRSHVGSMSNARNKGSMYYYHECLARKKAFDALRNSKGVKVSSRNRLIKQFMWYQLFIAYKGEVLLGLRVFGFYGSVFLLFKK
ncbi:glycosyltransferase family 2 protein [Echinicola soli]|uniref:Glycosyltransferase family 2 protein n=1 Tax=Echinicola soli TaxID=2591634 RepID=A0A514CJ41_9BACT|nr:glycosyltransferase family 2 protein [Echinicola soli]QDH79796.1 glycosyltransferase family 2 protein [Echinicola soli]